MVQRRSIGITSIVLTLALELLTGCASQQKMPGHKNIDVFARKHGGVVTSQTPDKILVSQDVSAYDQHGNMFRPLLGYVRDNYPGLTVTTDCSLGEDENGDPTGGCTYTIKPAE